MNRRDRALLLLTGLAPLVVIILVGRELLEKM